MTNTFRLSPAEKKNNLSRLRELLSRADDLTLNFQDIENDIEDHDIWVHVVDEVIMYTFTAQVVGKVYFIGKVAGEGKLYPWPQFFEVVSPYAQSQDCEEIMFSGDSSWENKLKHMGFSVKEYIYSVKV